MDPKGKNVLIVATFGPEAPARCPAPFLFAQAAAASGAEVSLFFVLQGVRLLKRGLAEDIVRNVAQKLQDDARVSWFCVEAVNQESIHNHNAYACIEKG